MVRCCLSHAGYSFESYCTRDRPGHAPAAPGASRVPGWGGDVNTNVQWCHIVKTKLGGNRIIMGGEVDCVETLDAATDSEREGTVELKTNLPVRTPEDQMKLDIKMLRICTCADAHGRYAVVPTGGAFHCDRISGHPGYATGRSYALTAVASNVPHGGPPAPRAGPTWPVESE